MQEASQRAAGATAMMQARQAAEARIAQELAEQQAEQHGEQQRRIDDAAATAVADEPEALDARAQARQDWREQAEQDAAVLRQMSAGEEVTFELHAEAHGAVVEVPPVPAPSARSIETSTPVAPAPLTALPTRRPGTSWDEPTPLVEIEDSSSPEEVRSSLSGFQNSFRRGVADAASQPASFPVASAPVPPPPPPPPVMTDAGFPQRQKGTSWVDLPPLAEESDAPDLDPEAVKSALNSFQSGWQQHKPTAPPPPPSEFGATGLPTRRPGAGLGNTNTNFVEDTSEERDADDVRSALGAFQGAKHRDSVEYNQPPQDKDM
jgi:hypothetical protein